MMFAAMPTPWIIEQNTSWITAVTAVAITAGLACQIILQVMARVDALHKAKKDEEAAEKAQAAAVLAAEQQQKASVKVAEVKEALVVAEAVTTEKLDELAKGNERIHTLVNSNMSVQLKLNAELSRWKADQTGDPEHIHAANLAEQMYAEHQSKQATVDAKAAKDAQDAQKTKDLLPPTKGD